MIDHHVDRPGVEAQQCVELTGPNNSVRACRIHTVNDRPAVLRKVEDPPARRSSNNRIDLTRLTPASLLGGHSACDPPDPISNSAVKPGSADGTNAQALEE